ncbi:porin family protein [uncultured Bacteroides sp.]|uniref:porin family protein n=1 Tax=uncultured Bacteroides sp. TaxID=162156 RepID=UPI002AABADE9|nr:porin family protein [uncultured Bacteroides sp.]
MKRVSLLLIGICCVCSLMGQNTDAKIPNSRRVNFGIKSGFNSSMYLVSKLEIDGAKIKDTQNNYKIGYFASVFARLNLGKHYIQPEVTYSISRCEIQFDKLGNHTSDIAPDYATVNSTIHSIEFPLLYGYNIVKKGPYGMSIFGGPKIKYFQKKHNKVTFENFDQNDLKEELYPLNISGVFGVGVNITNIYFDFRYELGFRNISKRITDASSENENSSESIVFDRRETALSFSLGIIF